jgi:nucleoid-associated protein YgaU
LFEFVKDAGERLFGSDAEEPAAPAAGDAAADAGVAAANQAKAVALAVQIRHLGFRVNDLQVEFDDGTATVHGSVASQREREIVVLTAGNTKGVARVDDRLSVDAPEPEPAAKMYTVVAGDTLSGIAKAQYGEAMKYMKIFEANKPMLEDPDKIYPGQVLRIPPLDG